MPASAPARALLTLLAVCVQSFMLLQVGFFYARLRWRHWGQPPPPPAAMEATPAGRGRSPGGSPARPGGGGGALRELGGEAGVLGAVISCVVMVRNEELNIRSTLRRLAGAAEHPGRLEVVVVDSGCTDGTIAAAEDEARTLPFGVAFVRAAAAGRGSALDAGTVAARGDIIFVCHADCLVPRHFDGLIRRGMLKPTTLATAFRFALNRAELPAGEGGLPGAGVMEFTVNLRAKWLQLPFGDQGLAITKARLTERYGGWGGAEYPLLEDFQLVQKLRQDGACGLGWIELIGEGGGLSSAAAEEAAGGGGAEGTLRCSPRRWRSLGVWRVNLVNQLVMLWFQRGATPQQLFDFYYGIRTDHVPRWLATLTAPLMPKKQN